MCMLYSKEINTQGIIHRDPAPQEEITSIEITL